MSPKGVFFGESPLLVKKLQGPPGKYGSSLLLKPDLRLTDPRLFPITPLAAVHGYF